MAARKVLAGFAALALSAGITVATAFSPCGHRACSDEVAASGLSGRARGACVKQVLADCRAGLCSCTGGSPPCSCATTTTTVPCSICFVTVTDQCLGPCSQQSDCGIEPNVLCLPVTELQRIGITCECPTTTTTTTTSTTTSTMPPPGCGNGVVDAGEQCDGQPFCTAACTLGAGICCDGYLGGAPACEGLGTILDSSCYYACVQAGARCAYGTCVASAGGGSACADVPFPSTSICCEGLSSCTATVVSGTSGLAQVVHDCAYAGFSLTVTVGTCGADGRCVPGG